MNFTWEGFLARNDNELGNNFGNLINRVLTFVHKYFEGRVPRVDPRPTMTDWTAAALAEVDEPPRALGSSTSRRFEIKAAMEAPSHAGQVGNRYFDESAPFTLAQDRPRPLRPQPRRRDADHPPDLRHARPGHAVRDGEGVGLAGHGDRRSGGRLGREACGRIPAGRQLGVPEILFPRHRGRRHRARSRAPAGPLLDG